MAKRLDCLGLGIAPVDILFQVETFPKPGAKIDASSLTIQGGGPIPTALATLGRLGMKPGLIAAVGKDIFGDFVKDELNKFGVDTSLLIRKPSPTAIAAGWYEKGSGRRTIILDLKTRIRPGDIKLDRLPDCRAVHLDGRDLPACLKLARWAKRKALPVVFDVGSIRNDVSPVFPLVDHLVCAADFAMPFTGMTNLKKAVERLASLCPGTIVITSGTKGALGFSRTDGWLRQKAFRVRTVDTTGAGDVYHGAYIFGLLSGGDLSCRMEIASAAAALKCTRPGGRLGIPTRAELQRFLSRTRPTYE